jgi:hypothetical protein
MEYKKPPQEEQVVLGGLHVAGLLGGRLGGRVARLLGARVGGYLYKAIFNTVYRYKSGTLKGRLPIQSSF